MTILATILLTILGYYGINRLIWKYIPDYYRYATALHMLKINHTRFDSNIYPGYRAIYIQDEHFDNIILYFNSKGKLQTK